MGKDLYAADQDLFADLFVCLFEAVFKFWTTPPVRSASTLPYSSLNRPRFNSPEPFKLS